MIIQGALFILGKKLVKYFKNEDFNQFHILFIEIACSLLPLICSIRTAPALNLAKEAIGTSLLNKKFFASTIIQLIINLGHLFSFYFYLKNVVDKNSVINSSGKDIVYLSYMFIFICFQYLLVNFVFNYKSIHRKHFTTNSILIIIVLFILTMTLQFLLYSGNRNYGWIKNFIEFEDNNERFEYRLQFNKLMIPCFILVDIILSMGVELIITRL